MIFPCASCNHADTHGDMISPRWHSFLILYLCCHASRHALPWAAAVAPVAAKAPAQWQLQPLAALLILAVTSNLLATEVSLVSLCLAHLRSDALKT